MNAISVLIVNDHVVMREGLSSVLNAEQDIHVVAATGSTTSVRELVQRFQPDVILLDLQLLGSIYQIASEAKEMRPGLKLVLTAAVNLPEYFRQGERLGANGFISALDSPAEIVRCVRKAATGEQHFAVNAVARSLVDKQRDGVNSRMEHPLSPREVDVLCCVAQAMTAKEIAKDLHISVKTVDRHKANIMNKLSMRSQIELARYAIRNGFVEA